MTRPRTRTLTGAAALGILMALSPAVPAAAAAEPQVTTEGGKTTLKLAEKEEEGGQYIPKGGQPQAFPEDEDFVPEVGDAVTDTTDYTQDGTKVGNDRSTCRVIKVVETTVSIDCVVTITFEPGTLKAAFVETFDLATEEDEDDGDVITVPIVAGTGAYQGAKGTASVQGVDDGNDNDGESTDEITFVFTTGGSQVSQTPTGGSQSGASRDIGGLDAGLLGLGAAAIGGGALLLAARTRFARRVH